MDTTFYSEGKIYNIITIPSLWLVSERSLLQVKFHTPSMNPPSRSHYTQTKILII